MAERLVWIGLVLVSIGFIAIGEWDGLIALGFMSLMGGVFILISRAFD